MSGISSLRQYDTVGNVLGVVVLGGLALIVGMRFIVVPAISDWSNQLTASTKRVTVIYPEYWPVNEYHNCSVLKDTQVLNCYPEHNGDPVHSFVMDVEFTRTMDTAYPNWTCQNTGKRLVCRN